MKHKTNRYGIYEADYTKFGGIVYPSDFNTSYPNGMIAERIARDDKFDRQCRNLKQKRKKRRNKND